jgi:hypothetical protein
LGTLGRSIFAQPERGFLEIAAARPTPDDRVTDELLDGSAVSLDRLAHRGEIAGHEVTHSLGVDTLAELRRSD